jgi:hypothetical protein
MQAKVRACDRRELFAEQLLGLEAWKVPPAVADCHVHRTTAEIHRLVRSMEPQIHVGIGNSEGRYARYNPARHEGARRRKRHNIARPSCVQARDRLGKGVEAFPQHEIEPLPLRCQKHHAWVPLKKPETDPILKQPNLMADRCRRNR